MERLLELEAQEAEELKKESESQGETSGKKSIFKLRKAQESQRGPQKETKSVIKPQSALGDVSSIQEQPTPSAAQQKV